MSDQENARSTEKSRAERSNTKAPAAQTAAPVTDMRGGAHAQRGLSAPNTNAQHSNNLSGGATGALPFCAEMESAYGVDLSGVEARFGVSDLANLGARAASEGNVIAFIGQDPTIEDVAEEVAHWLQRQQSGDGAVHQKVDGGASDHAEQDAQAAAGHAAAGEHAEVTEAPTAQIHRAPDDKVSLALTTDLNHPWLKAAGVTDLGPYAFMPAYVKLILKPTAVFKESSDKANAWQALLKGHTYQPEKVTFKKNVAKPELEKDVTASMGEANAVLVEKRAKAARGWVSKNNLGWATAMSSYKDGLEPKLAAISAHEGVGSEGHTVERHILGSGDFKTERDIARRAAFNYLHPAEGKATVFKTETSANAAAADIHGTMKGSWLSLRNTILALKDKVGGAGHEMTGAAATSYVAFEAENGVSDSDKPAYLGLGAGTRPLFAEDVNSKDWKDWASVNKDIAEPGKPLTKPFAPSKTTAFVRPTVETTTGGWFFKTLFPDG